MKEWICDKTETTGQNKWKMKVVFIERARRKWDVLHSYRINI